MKTLKSELLPALESACRVAGRRNSLPILNSLLLECKDGKLMVRGTDIDQNVIESVECEGKMDSLCVPAKRIVDAVKFGGESVELSVKDQRLTCLSGSRFEIAGLSFKEFPEASTDKLVDVAVNTADLIECINKVKWATSMGESRLALEQVWVEGATDKLISRASNGRIGVLYSKPSICGAFSFGVHTPWVSAFASALERKNAHVLMSDRLITIRHDRGEFSFRRTEQDFPVPGFTQIMAGNTVRIGEMSSAALRDMCLGVFSVVNEDTHKVARFDFEPTGLSVTGESKISSYKQTHVGKFEKRTLCLNSELMKDALASLDGCDMEMLNADRMSPLFIKSGFSHIAIMGLQS